MYISDDASPNNPKILLDEYKKILKFTYKRFEYNLGANSLEKHWQRSLELIDNEDWVSILGDDDVLSSNYVEKFYQYLGEINNRKIDVIRFSSVVIDDADKIMSQIYTNPIYEKSTDFLERRRKGGTRSSLSEYVFRREKILNHKFINLPLAWHSDDLLVLECSSYGMVFSINDSFVLIRKGDFSISGSSNNLDLKTNASFKYYSYLLNKRVARFTEIQQNIFYTKLEGIILFNKRRLDFWYSILKTYLKNGRIVQLMGVVRKS